MVGILGIKNTLLCDISKVIPLSKTTTTGAIN